MLKRLIWVVILTGLLIASVSVLYRYGFARISTQTALTQAQLPPRVSLMSVDSNADQDYGRSP